MSKAFDIAGYTFQSETLCAEDTIEALIGQGEASPGARGMTTEDALNQIAGANGIDRQDERSYDSSEFPKVVFLDGVLPGETCDSCGQEL